MGWHRVGKRPRILEHIATLRQVLLKLLPIGRGRRHHGRLRGSLLSLLVVLTHHHLLIVELVSMLREVLLLLHILMILLILLLLLLIKLIGIAVEVLPGVSVGSLLLVSEVISLGAIPDDPKDKSSDLLHQAGVPVGEEFLDLLVAELPQDESAVEQLLPSHALWGSLV